MELFVPFSRLVSVLAIALVVLILPVYGQITTPCTASMLTTFTPCMNFITNSTANGTSPTADCCSGLKSLTGTSMACACLIVTGSIPFQVPINRTLAISLPRACNMVGVPLLCQASAAPVAAPGPAAFGPTASPSPKALDVPEPTPSTLAPEADTTPLLTPPSTTGNSGVPTSTTGSRSVLPPSAAMPSYSFSPSLMLFALGFVLLKYY